MYFNETSLLTFTTDNFYINYCFVDTIVNTKYLRRFYCCLVQFKNQKVNQSNPDLLQHFLFFYKS